MQRKFISNLLLVIFINLLIKPFWILGVDRAVQNSVGEHSYGLYYTLFNFSFIFSIFLDFGLTNFNSRLISQNNHLLNKYLPNLLFIKIFLSAVYFIISFSWAYACGYKGYELFLLLVLCFNQLLNSLVLYFRSNIAALHLFKTDSFLSILDKLLMIIIILPLLLIPSFKSVFKIEYFIYGQGLSFLITSIIAGFLVLKYSGKIKLKFDLTIFKILLKQSYPFAIMVFLMSIYNKVDTVLLERIYPNGQSETGIYAYSYRLLDAVSMIAFLFSGLLLPIFSKMIKEKQDLSSILNLSFSLLLLPSIIFSFSCFLYSDNIIALFYHSNNAYSSSIFSILIFSFIGIANSYIVSTLLTANGNIKELIWISLVGVIINIGLNIILIPKYGAIACAITSLITFSLITIIQSIYVRRYFYFEIKFLSTLKLFFVIATMYALFYLLKFTIIHSVLSLLLVLSYGLLSSILIRLIPLKSIVEQFKNTNLRPN